MWYDCLCMEIRDERLLAMHKNPCCNVNGRFKGVGVRETVYLFDRPSFYSYCKLHCMYLFPNPGSAHSIKCLRMTICVCLRISYKVTKFLAYDNKPLCQYYKNSFMGRNAVC